MESKAGHLHHVEIYVSDLNRSKEFWGWFLGKLGYEKYQEWAGGVSYKLDETYLVFVQTEKKYLDIPYHRCRTGLNHLAFHASSREQVDEFTRELKKRGVNILYQDMHPFAGGPGYYAVYFEDPDRIKVELAAQ
jgi:Lactoylglutathione lyase and related lyases